MDNVFVRQDPAGNIKMDKEKSTEKIDGAVATVMALDRATRNAVSYTHLDVYKRQLLKRAVGTEVLHMGERLIERLSEEKGVAIEKALSVSLAMEQLKKRSPKHKAKRAKE